MNEPANTANTEWKQTKCNPYCVKLTMSTMDPFVCVEGHRWNQFQVIDIYSFCQCDACDQNLKFAHKHDVSIPNREKKQLTTNTKKLFILVAIVYCGANLKCAAFSLH